MPFNFPDPAVSTTATNPVTGASYQWRADPGKWVLTGGPAEAPNPPVTISLLPPDGPQKGDLWIHEETLIEYAWDGTQWFEVGSSCGGDIEEEEEDQYYPFVNSFKLVAPDDFSGENGTATLLTNAYAAGDDSYLSPLVEVIKFAYTDLNDRKPELALEGDIIQLTPDNESEYGSGTLYGELKVTAVTTGGSSITYDVDFDTSRSVRYTEGDIVHYRISKSDLYVKKTGDTMTGALVMDDADKILMQDTKLDFLITGESLKDLNGDPILENDGKGNMVEQWDDSIDRFSHIESLPPRILRSDGTFGADTSATFGIRVEIDDGNTHRNRFVVGNRNGDAVTITGGTGPNVQFGTGFDGNQNPQNGRIDWKAGEEGGVKITNIPTPTFENPDSRLAVNKGYVDERDEEIRQDIIELEEEIDAIAPSVERGEWSYTNTGVASVRGSYSMFTDTFDQGLGDVADIFAAVENIVLNEKDLEGTIHSFANVEPGQLLEVFESGDSDYGLYEIIKVESKSGGGVNTTPLYNYWSIDVKLVRTGANDKAETKARFKIFSPPEGGTADGFVLKSGDEMTGNLTMEGSNVVLNNEQPDTDLKLNESDVDSYVAFKTTDENDKWNTTSANLWQPGKKTALMTNGDFYTKTKLYTEEVKGWNAVDGTVYSGSVRSNSSNIRLNWDGNSRVLANSTGGFLKNGSASSNEQLEWGTGGILKYNGSNRVIWSEGGGILKGPTNTVFSWNDDGIASLRAGNSTGSTGQVLTKASSGYQWASPVGRSFGRRFKFANTSYSSTGQFGVTDTKWGFNKTDYDGNVLIHSTTEITWSTPPKMTIWTNSGTLVVAIELSTLSDYNSTALKFRRSGNGYKELKYDSLTSNNIYIVSIEGYF